MRAEWPHVPSAVGKPFHDLRHQVEISLQMVLGMLLIEAHALRDEEVARQRHGAHRHLLVLAHLQERLASTQDERLRLVGAADDVRTRCAGSDRAAGTGRGSSELAMEADICSALLLVVRESMTCAIEHGLPAPAGAIAGRQG